MKTFIIQKNNHKDNDSKPDYRIVAKEGEKFVEIGAGWKKQDKKGNAYISCSLSKPYGDKPGYKIVTEEPEKIEEIPQMKGTQEALDDALDNF